MELDCPLGDRKLRRDLFVLLSTRQQIEDLLLTPGEGVGVLRRARGGRLHLAHQFGDDHRLEQRSAAVNNADSVEKLIARYTFEQVTLHPRLNRFHNAFVAVEGGEGNGAHAGVDGLHAAQRFHPVNAGHLQIDEDDIGAVGVELVDEILAATGLGHHIEIGLGAEDGDKAVEHHRVVVGNDQANLGGHGAASRGMVTCNEVPSVLVSNCICPPKSRARS